MRGWIFAKRNLLELLRSPLSYVFCVGFPVVMLLLFYMISQFSGGAYWFELYRLTPGICVFSYMFVMLFMALLVSRDRASAFQTRLYTTPMTHLDFTVGYAVPGVLLCLGQAVLCYLTSFVMLLSTGSRVAAEGITGVYGIGIDEFGKMITAELTIPWSGIVLSVFSYLPVILLFVFCGIFIGCMLNDRSAPGVTSAILSVGGMLSGAWMPLETMGNFETVARCLPFYPATLVGRSVFLGEELTWDVFGISILTVSAYMAAALAGAVLAFRHRMRSDG